MYVYKCIKYVSVYIYCLVYSINHCALQLLNQYHIFIYSFKKLFLLFMATPVAYGSSQARG